MPGNVWVSVERMGKQTYRLLMVNADPGVGLSTGQIFEQFLVLALWPVALGAYEDGMADLLYHFDIFLPRALHAPTVSSADPRFAEYYSMVGLQLRLHLVLRLQLEVLVSMMWPLVVV